MQMRSILPMIAVLVLVVTAGCSTALNNPGEQSPAQQSPASNDVTSPPDDDRTSSQERVVPIRREPRQTITVGADGQIETEPDQVVIRVAVEATGESASSVREQLAANASSMRTALTEFGIDRSQIVTTDFDIRNRERFRRDRDEPAFTGRHGFSITLSEDLNDTGEVIVVAVENGATSVNDVRFTLSEEKREALHEEALVEAMTSARSQAEIIASQSDLSITSVGSVQTTDIRFRPVRFEAFGDAGGAGGAATSIEAGVVTVSAQVEVTYNATSAS